MVNRQWLKLTLMIVLCSCSSAVKAQFGGVGQPGNSPTYSPYLNLLRSGNGGGVGQNYFGLVRPQQQFAQQNQALGQGLQNLQMQSGGMQTAQGGYGYSQLGMTGHPVIFNSFGTSRFSGGYTGFGGSGFGGGGGGQFIGGQFGGSNFGGGNQFGGQSNLGGMGTTGGGFGGANFGGVTGHMSQFGGIGNTYQPGR